MLYNTQKKNNTPTSQPKLGIAQLLNNKKPIPIPIPSSNQVSPVASDLSKPIHSHKGSQIDVSSLTKLIKQSKPQPSEVLLARAKEVTGQFKKSTSVVKQPTVASPHPNSPKQPIIHNYAILKDLMRKPEPNHINRNTFNFHFVIGIGGFGKVWKVEHKKTGHIYAMKEMSKALIITKKSVNSVMNERTLLSQLKYSLLVNMYYAYQDRENLYLVMDYMRGGDLRYHIGKMRRFSEDQTRFFVASIFLGLEYIHSNNIIHRDIKPENLVLDENGYVHITDFGIARVMKQENASDTSGTPGYMAPEVMYRQNHSFAVDYYALGVIAYEFMLGKRPYLGRTRQEIREQIVAKQVQIKRSDIPEGWSLEGADFINRLIQRKPQVRLGNNGSLEVRQHPWFSNFPWEKLEKFELEPPYKPNQTEDNFDQKQIILEDEENNELIQQNQLALRDPSTSELFAGYEYLGQLQSSSTTDSNSSIKHSRNLSQNQFLESNQKKAQY